MDKNLVNKLVKIAKDIVALRDFNPQFQKQYENFAIVVVKKNAEVNKLKKELQGKLTIIERSVERQLTDLITSAESAEEEKITDKAAELVDSLEDAIGNVIHMFDEFQKSLGALEGV